MNPPSRNGEPADSELLNKLFHPLLIRAESDIPVRGLAVGQGFWNPVADVILHERNKPVSLPTEDAERKADVRNHCRALRYVRH